MKILMLAPQPFFEPRGTPFSVLGRLNALSELGHQVDLVTYHIGRDIPVPGVAIHRTPRISWIKSIKIGPSVPKLFLDLLVFFKAVQLLLSNRYDLLHTHEEASFFGVILAKLFRVKHLYDMHSSPAQQLSNFQITGGRAITRTFEWIESKVINHSDAVITICPALEDYVSGIKDDAPQMMIENVGAGLDYDTVSDEDVEALRTAYPSIEGKKVILYAGTFELYQGLDLLVRSARQVTQRHQDVMYLMAGGRPDQVRHCMELAEEMGVTQYFHFAGIRPPEEIPVLIKLSDILVSPRIDGTNTPLKVYSYLQSGKPIVATNLYTHTQVLNPEVAILADPEPDAFAKGIIALLDSPDMSSGLGLRARRLFEEQYSFKTFVKKTDQVLRMAMGHGPDATAKGAEMTVESRQ